MTSTSPPRRPHPGPPSQHHLAVMIWLAVFPTLTALDVPRGNRLSDLPTVARTFVLATIAVPIIIYGVIPQRHRARTSLLGRS